MDQDETWRQVGLGPGHIVLDGDPASPLPKGADPPIFGPYLLQPNGCMDQDATWYGGRHQLRQLCAPKMGAEPPSPIFGPFLLWSNGHNTSACIKMPLSMEVGLSPGDFVLDRNPAP